MTATSINPNLTSSLDSLPLSDFVPYLLVASASTCGAFIWQTTRYVREASLTRKSHLPFGTFVVTIIKYAPEINITEISLLIAVIIIQCSKFFELRLGLRGVQTLLR
ncbi:hypothetical protein QCA50_007537 [Cerrena zonata]|uniref:Uncharacterized protein n=1 Tax=Cerrena zonata TaxID=2478898 RepID=A0AAW0GFF7_9APHY